MTEAEPRVAPLPGGAGFVLTPLAFEAVLRENGLEAPRAALIDAARRDLPEAVALAEAFAERLLDARWPIPEIQGALVTMERAPIAVGLALPGATDAPFGAVDAVAPDQVVPAVLRAWALAHRPETFAHWLTQGRDPASVRLAVRVVSAPIARAEAAAVARGSSGLMAELQARLTAEAQAARLRVFGPGARLDEAGAPRGLKRGPGAYVRGLAAVLDPRVAGGALRGGPFAPRLRWRLAAVDAALLPRLAAIAPPAFPEGEAETADPPRLAAHARRLLAATEALGALGGPAAFGLAACRWAVKALAEAAFGAPDPTLLGDLEGGLDLAGTPRPEAAMARQSALDRLRWGLRASRRYQGLLQRLLAGHETALRRHRDYEAALARLLPEWRRLALAVGAWAAGVGALARAEDALLLTPVELVALASESVPWSRRRLVASRDAGVAGTVELA